MNTNETSLLQRASKSQTHPTAASHPKRGGLRFDEYDLGGFYDEMFVRTGEPRAIARRLMASIEALPDGDFIDQLQVS